MPRQANGQYVPPANTAAVSGQSVNSIAFNTLETDIGTEITNSVDRLGRSAMQAALPMGNNKITGLATPTLATDGVTKAYADSLGPAAFIVTGTGTADVITGVFTPTITSLTNGLTVEVRATAANATTTPTFQADATAAKTIVKGAGIALIAGNIAGAGFWMSLTYDSVLDKWVLNNPSVTLPPSQTPLAGAQGLVITNNSGTPNTNIDVTADQAVMISGVVPIYAQSVSLTINTTTTGANGIDTGARATSTWYNLFLISDGTTTAGLASLSATAPTMPGVYVYKVRIGAMRTDGSGNFLRTKQVGNVARYVVTAATNTAALSKINAATSTGVYQSTATGNFVPPTAAQIDMLLSVIATTGAWVASNSSYGDINSTTNPPPCGSVNPTGSIINQSCSILLESANVSFASNSGGNFIWAAGWRDKMNAT